MYVCMNLCMNVGTRTSLEFSTDFCSEAQRSEAVPEMPLNLNTAML
jgi:hypothetical protein